MPSVITIPGFGLPATAVDASVDLGGIGIDVDPGRVDPLVVTISLEGGPEQLVDWLGHDIDITWPANALPTCGMTARTADGWLVNVGAADAPILMPIDDALPDDALVTVRTARPNPDTDSVLFAGYLQQIERRAAAGKTARVSLVHRASDLFDGLAYVVRGQLQIEQSEWSSPTRPFWSKAEVAAYNPEGEGNCGRLLSMEDEHAQGSEPESFRVPLATHMFDASRQSYSYARVFIDLFYRARRLPDGELGPWPAIRDANLWQLIYDRGLLDIDPDTLMEAPSDPWDRALLGKPVSLALEGLRWGEALTLLCARCGIGWAVDTRPDGEGVVRDILRFVVPGASRRTSIKSPSKRYRTDDKTWAQVRRDADVVACAIVTDYSGAVNEVIEEGAPLLNEVTVELLPGWGYSSSRAPQVDVNPGNASDVAAALAQVGSDAWAKKYTVGGDEFHQHYLVLRLWVLPDYGALTHLARTWSPWTAARYQVFDFGALRIGHIDPTLPGGVIPPGGHAVRPRPLQRCLTGATSLSGPPEAQISDDTFPVVVEASYDSGATWRQLSAHVRVLERRLGVYLEAPDLHDLRDDETTSSLPEAYIRGTLRLRVTGVIETDWVAASPQFVSSHSLSRRRRGVLLQRPREFLVRQREDRVYTGLALVGPVSGGNSQFRNEFLASADRLPADERGDLEQLAWLQARLERGDRVRHTGSVEIPGVITPQVVGGELSGWRPGDEIEAILAEDGAYLNDLPLRSRAGEDSFAMVAAVRWSYSVGDGRGGGLSARTTIALEDSVTMISPAAAGRE